LSDLAAAPVIVASELLGNVPQREDDTKNQLRIIFFGERLVFAHISGQDFTRLRSIGFGGW